MNSTAGSQQVETLVGQMTKRMEELAVRLSASVQEGAPSLAELEQAVLQGVKEVGNELLAGLCQLGNARYPAARVPCACGQEATYQRQRMGQTKTLLGEIRVRRAYYRCAACHRGHCPLDRQLGFCAGGVSAGLEELLALLGAQCPFAEAVELVAKLSLVEVSANTCRSVTEGLGEVIDAAERQDLRRAWAGETTVAVPEAPSRLYISMDGTTVHIAEQGWRELRLGAVYTTRPLRSLRHPEQVAIRSEAVSFYTDFDDAETFGNYLWLEACRRGVQQASEVVVLGDGAHWIWRLAEEHFPQATQILDWYHATVYVWNCAHALYGDGTQAAKEWAKLRLDELWNGQLPTLLAHLYPLALKHKVVRDTITYFKHNQSRMDYPAYRAKGLQIGSGTIESGCKHLVAQRLDQAGMLWSLDGARAVAKVRARIKSRRWPETLALRPPTGRTYQRHAA
jgi:hypothetical protein